MQTVRSSLVEVRTLDTKTFDEDNGHTRVGSYHTQGSGVIIGSDGIIVTNTHIVFNAPHIFVGLPDGTILEARIVYSSDADFSFLKIDPPYPLQTISWADSSLAKIGTPIIALSNADDGQQHIVGGEITNMIDGASSESVELFELNLDLYHGDSGGPLLDDQGDLLGLITAKRIDKDNKSYAIASNKIQQEYLQYKQNPPAS
jgi:S1-C subfamily serine protease